MPTYIDRALVYDPATRRCDRAFDGRDCVIDATPATPLLLAVGLDRRARPDDALPDTVDDFTRPTRLDARRGWCGDFIDAQNRVTGSRMWLLRRRKQDEPTRRLAESALKEAVEPLAAARGWTIDLVVRWLRPNWLGYRIAVDGRPTIALNTGVG